MSSNVKELGLYLVEHIKSLFVVLISLLSVSTSLLFIGFVFRKLIDNGLNSGQISIVNNSIFLISGLICIFAVGSFFRSYYINLITLKVISKLKSDTFKNLLKVDLTRFEDLKIGDIISRLGSDIEMVGNLIINFLSFFIRNSIMLLGGITLMFVESPKLSLIVMFSIPVLLFPILRLSKHVRSLSKRVLEEQSLLASNIEENFVGIRTLYAYNQQQYLSDQFDKKIHSNIKHASVRLRLRSLFFALAIAIITGSITLVIWVGSIDILSEAMTSGEMISFIYYAMIVGMSAGGIAELLNELQNPFAALERVLELRDLKPNIAPVLNEEFLDQSYSIRFEKVNFSYPSRPDILVLKNISLEISQGKFTAIVGKSGSGKSTLLQLLLKFYNHQDGNIFVGSKNISLIKDEFIRSKIAYVEQNPTIFSGTIRSNINFSRPDANDDEINNIAKLCGILNFTNSLELGLDTEIGERGIRISGGQKQRIAIARALLYNPEILLLDEATSALDTESEEQILLNVQNFLAGKTIISVAHRISSIEKADEILVINQGALVSQGSHTQLLHNSKIYNVLYKEQK
ncbi:MAG: ATP-binding cassette domain-containing protein [Rickettsiaceae bacterium]|jgi:ATP-binding cassette subfamily B protein|nr:ATP-binding cassette domain-containing protein [Rickettsiaceae bacterium]